MKANWYRWSPVIAGLSLIFIFTTAVAYVWTV